jgi:4-amino-4-deoxy-L-arabinose transferase-like glycosyltransferase
MKDYIKNLKESLKSRWPLIIVIVAAFGFFFFASSFNYLSQNDDFVKWLSPDETANYASSKLYAETGNLAVFEKYNLISKDIIHPRSFRSDWGWVKPVSFLGMPLLYGKIAKILGTDVLPYLSPLFGAIGLVFFYLLVKRIFGRSNAIISTLLAAVFPIYVYFSARSMFHNILFMSLLMGGLYFASRMTEANNEAENSYFKKHRRGFVFSLLSGLLVAGALTARTSELIWVGPLIFVLWLFNLRRLGLVRPFFFLYGALISFLPILYWNNVLYGSFISSGYPELNDSLFSLSQDGSALVAQAGAGKLTELKSVLLSIKDTIFHFGFNLGQSYRLFNAYVRDMFPWLYYAAGAGVALYLIFFKNYAKRRWLWLGLWALSSSLLVVYYGSWTFFDNPDRSSTIGNSYTRYWLPLYFGALPFASLALVKITGLVRYSAAVWGLRLAAIAVIATLSVQFVWLDPAEGIKVSIEKQTAAKQEWSKVLALTENDAVIITRYHDKLLFPERKVVIGLFDDKNMINEYANIARRLPTYYYNFSYQDKDLEYLNNGPLKETGLQLELVEAITDRFNLYSLKPLILEE